MYKLLIQKRTYEDKSVKYILYVWNTENKTGKSYQIQAKQFNEFKRNGIPEKEPTILK